MMMAMDIWIQTMTFPQTQPNGSIQIPTVSAITPTLMMTMTVFWTNSMLSIQIQVNNMTTTGMGLETTMTLMTIMTAGQTLMK